MTDRAIDSDEAPLPPPPPSGSVREVARLFLRLGLTAFGGPTAHIALMRHEFVAVRRWVDERRFLDLLGAANVLPGPTSTELAIALGRARAGFAGMLVGGSLFILPAVVIVTVLAWLYAQYGTLPAAAAVLYGVQPVVVAVVVQAVVGLAPTALPRVPEMVIGAAAAALFLIGIDPVVILVAAGIGLLAFREVGRRTTLSRALVAVPGFVRAAVPSATAIGATPEGLASLFLLFLKVGALVYGSGYVLVAFLRADLVEGLGLLTDRQLLDAVAVGQVTPGPVFTTATFIGYLLAGVPGAIVATVAVFLPAFVLVAAVHPFVDRIRSSPTLSAILDGVNAASLGLMAGVTVELARSALVDIVTVALAAGAALVLLRFRPNPAWLLLAGALVGLAASAAASR